MSPARRKKPPAAKCSVEGCDDATYGAGLCRAHDNALRRAKRVAKQEPSLHPIAAARLTNRRRTR